MDPSCIILYLGDLSLFWWLQSIFWPMNPISVLPHQSFLYSPNPCNCLQEISPWISYRHFKLNMSKLNSSSPQTGSLMAFPISGNGSTLHPVNQARNLWFILNSSHFPHCLNPINHQVLLIPFSKSASFQFILLSMKETSFALWPQPACMCMCMHAQAHTHTKWNTSFTKEFLLSFYAKFSELFYCVFCWCCFWNASNQWKTGKC